MMFVVFWTVRSDNPGVFYDSYTICDDEETARKLLDEVTERDSTYAAGMGPIIDSTEHWHVQH
jgi:hypothetical protein